MKKTKNIIFDFDGVLVDNIDKLFEVHNQSLDHLDWEGFLGISKGNTLKGLRDFKEVNQKAFWKKWEGAFENMQVTKESFKFLTWAKEQKYNLFIVTSNMIVNIDKALENSSIGTDFFKEILAKEKGCLKVEKIRSLETKYNISLTETLFITDSLGDIKEGKEVGVSTLGVTWGIHNRSILEEGLPEYICDSWVEVKAVLMK